MWQRFTERARRVVFFAQEEAGRLGENNLCTEHLLLGLVRENDCVAARILERMGISLEQVRSDIERQAVQGEGRVGQDMQLAPRAKRVIDLSYDEARNFNSNYIGTEHLLLGLIREAEGLAGRILIHLGVDLERTRVEVMKLQKEEKPEKNEVSLQAMGDTGENNREPATEINGEMWKRYTEPARQTVFFAQEEAGRLGENYVSTEHLLLGLTRNSECSGIQVLETMGVPLTRIRSEIERQVVRGDGRLGEERQLTPRAKRVLDLAFDEARQMNSSYVGTEHILLGLIREGEGLAGRVLNNLGISLEQAQLEVLLLSATNRAEGNVQKQEGKDAFSRDALMRLLRGVANRIQSINPGLAQEVFTKRLIEESTGADFSPGDLGTARSTNGRETVEVCLDAPAFVQLTAVYTAKDTHGYRAMANGDQTMFLVPVGTPLKLLATPEGVAAVARSHGSYVRVLAGPYTGYAGWIYKGAFERTGADAGEFPPRDEM